MALLGYQEHLDHQGCKVIKVQRELLVVQDNQVKMEILDFKVQQGERGLVDNLEVKAVVAQPVLLVVPE